MQNSPGLKGIHISMKSGMLAAETIIKAFEKNSFTQDSLDYRKRLDKERWIKKELYEGRNFSQALSKKGILKLVHLGAQYFTKGRGIQDMMPLEEDCKTLVPVKKKGDGKILSPDKSLFDNVLYVDKLTGVYLSKTMHREDQPSHIIIHDQDICVNECFTKFQCPCTKFCPGDVYELETDNKTYERRIKLNPSNCLHCKTCVIKDPYKNITWTCPEGGDGPGYTIL
jgi:electron-transferring-flavoprotein dehydrogenase